MSDVTNPFILPNEAYHRDLDIVQGYHRDAAKYLSLQTGEPFEKCLAFTREMTAPGKELGMTDPKALVLTRNKVGDRQPSNASFMKFLGRVQKQELLLSPSMAVYVPEAQKQSTHSLYIAEGVKKRKAVKHEQFVAERAGNAELALVKKGEQNNLKINNNSYSGATVSTATVLYYKSTHSSLTSTCRVAASYANAANEKFIAGNRHYYNPEVTKANLLSIINNCDMGLVEKACVEFNLHYPTPQEAMDCVMYSTGYWSGPQHEALIARMLANMTPVERAAIVYIGDLYHLHKHNPEFVETFLKELSEPAATGETETDDNFDSYDGDIQLLANFLCYDEVQGRDKAKLLEEAPEVYEKIKATGRRAMHTLMKYQSVIHGLWLTNTMPSSIHAMPSIYRRAAIISDTDSTMFTMQYWVEQLFGHVSFSVAAKRVVFAVVFLVSGLMVHILAKQSRNMGVSDAKLRLLAMKNEFYFAVMAMTTRSKHYFASQDAQEGIMFLEPRLEVKGVGLRDSKVPPKINKAAKKLMVDIIETIKSESSLDMDAILLSIADQERDIVESIKAGKFDYMTTGQIKAADSYKVKEEAPAFQQYLLWRDVFAPAFGVTQEPPYQIVKVSLRANNRTEIKEWCDQMQDQALAARLQDWLKAKGKTSISTLFLPFSVIESNGIPADIVVGIDTRKIIANTMGVFYLILESLGILLQDKNNARQLSDYY